MIKLFDKDTLLLYFFWCIGHFVSMYHIWQLEALTRLKENLRNKWVDDLPNLNLLIERVEKRDRTIMKNFFFEKLKKKIF